MSEDDGDTKQVDIGKKAGYSLRSPSKLCPKCQNMVYRYYVEQREHPILHYESCVDLKESARNGCGVCAQFLANFISVLPATPRHTSVEWTGGRRHVTCSLYVPCLKGDLAVLGLWHNRFMRKENGEQPQEAVFMVTFFATARQALDYDAPKPNTRDSLKLCKDWLEDCFANHECCAFSSKRPLPTRLIAVGNGEVAPKIVFSEHLRAEKWTQYVTLSHCWGSLQFTTLTTANIEEFQRCIPKEALPKTFRDAIEICRYLDLPYLWIDSLCIIQDSEMDWQRESSLMAQVYGQCNLNIAATAAEDGSVGCFFEREKSWRCQFTADPDHPDKLYDCFPYQWRHPRRNVLRRRAWIIQERYLSRRTLHFTDLQVFWECDEEASCEFCPMGLSEYFDDRIKPSTYFSLDRRPLTHDKWPWLVVWYSRARLTKPEDRLAAIAGLARTMQNEQSRGKDGDIDDDNADNDDDNAYVAGMWSRDLERQLCWSGSRYDPKPVHWLSGCKCPTWSWASLDRDVKFMEIETLRARVHGLTFQYVDAENQFGDVEDAVLRLDCDVFCRGIIHFSKPLHMTVEIGYPCPETADGRIYLDCFDEYNEPSQSIQAYFLPIGLPANPRFDCVGLILEATGKKGEYNRIGFFESQTPIDDFEKLSGGPQSKEYKDLFAEVVVGENGEQHFLLNLV
ncbi:heterokaryon incompatibility protein-domain-containing protein [Xylariaceae sp. FL0662B]|nr:heterokaryon incompatibility protein-domain-containing protein [Xylariaceae sp. FL0662B]